jgi:two-component system OmpR family response regulator
MKILVVEDNDRLRKSVIEYLRDEGFAADAVADGEEALHRAQEWDYDVLVLDVMIPAPDGFEVLRRLRAAGKTAPVIMLTARTGLEDRLHGLNHGADDYMTKPFELAELVARIRSLVRRARHAPNPRIQIGTLEMNTVAKSILLAGERVDLTAREYALLELLALRRDEVVSREFLYEHLFDERDETMSNMLDVYIYKLRHKLGKGLIRTRRGMGYQIADPASGDGVEVELEA